LAELTSIEEDDAKLKRAKPNNFNPSIDSDDDMPQFAFDCKKQSNLREDRYAASPKNRGGKLGFVDDSKSMMSSNNMNGGKDINKLVEELGNT
jgi:hypothetical protein